jgi:hypothetical protein
MICWAAMVSKRSVVGVLPPQAGTRDRITWIRHGSIRVFDRKGAFLSGLFSALGPPGTGKTSFMIKT